MRKQIDSAILLAVCTALLYSWSTANYHGFLTTVNLDSDMMERSFHQVIYSGLIISFRPIMLVIFLLTSALFVWSHGILPTYIDYVRASFKAKRKMIKVRQYWIGKRVTLTIEKNEKVRFNRFGLYSLYGAIFILSLVYFEEQGQQKAENIIEKHYLNKNIPNSIINVVINKKETLLLYLACGSKNCAGIERKSNRIFYFSQANGYSFTLDKEM